MKRTSAGVNGYIPLDALLDRPAIRILRVLQHFDWIEPEELLDLCGAPTGKRDRNTWSVTLGRHLRERMVQRREWRMADSREPNRYYTVLVYRITAKGRRSLRSALRVDRRVLDDGYREVAA